ncbi:MAG: hypothetical protein FJ319_11090 [SAR202 cluster bacterium]|nr:hypothetical protein [SAR202 cluster bacterium]
MDTDVLIVRQIEKIQRELDDLKQLIGERKKSRKSLMGILKGVDVSDEEIEIAKRSLSGGIEKYESGS